MKLSQFNFRLPGDKIAQFPTEYRDESRLMVLHRKTGEIEHKVFKEIINYFDEKDVFCNIGDAAGLSDDNCAANKGEFCEYARLSQYLTYEGES